MSPRLKKLLALLVLLPGMLLYIGIVVTLADRLPKFWLAQLLYFIIAGIAWALPVMPLMTWMEKDPSSRRDGDAP